MPKAASDQSSKPAKPSEEPRAASVGGRRLFPMSWQKAYALFAVVFLLASTVVWSVLGAHLNQGNADELVNPRLFENFDTFQGATFPGAHSFLMKWPIFLLVKLFGASTLTFTMFTIVVTMLTVGSLAYIIYRIERRPVVFGTIILALASVLAFVPTQPYPGGLLPVNMAMIATRNLEYVLYILSLTFLIRSSGLKSKSFWFALTGLTLLVASDKLFMTLSAGGAVIMLAASAVFRKREQLMLSIKWLLTGLVSACLAALVLLAIDKSGLTHIASHGGSNPYEFVLGAKQLVLGVLFGLLDLPTNFGANLVYDVPVLKDTPHVFLERIVSLHVFPYLINLAVFIAGLCAAVRLVYLNFRHAEPVQRQRTGNDDVGQAINLSLMLLATTAAAFVAFVITDHYYAVDSRYLAVSLFALFCAGAVIARQQKVVQVKPLLIAGAVFVFGTVTGLIGAAQIYDADAAAMKVTTDRTKAIAAALDKHHVDALMGSYWRVMPAVQNNDTVKPLPLADCLTTTTVQSSSEWRMDISKHSFAYIISFDKGLVPFPNCSMEEVVAEYGDPSSEIVIAGTENNPLELLLFYDKGTDDRARRIPPTDQKTHDGGVIAFDHVTDASCPGKPTIMNIVAHQDDDLLFQSTDLLNAVKAGDCVRTVFVTAGDAGGGQDYWLSRENGAKAAYSQMLDIDGPGYWISRKIQIAEHQTVTLVQPVGDPRVMLVFMRLPDGNIDGSGFQTTNRETLERLRAGGIGVLHGLESQTYYSSQELSDALTAMMRVFVPTEVRTQAPSNVGRTFNDHSDHKAVGAIATGAYQNYGNPAVPIKHYIGYPVRERPENISGDALMQKTAAFAAYSMQAQDTGCTTVDTCLKNLPYSAYLKRQYTVE